MFQYPHLVLPPTLFAVLIEHLVQEPVRDVEDIKGSEEKQATYLKFLTSENEQEDKSSTNDPTSGYAVLLPVEYQLVTWLARWSVR